MSRYPGLEAAYGEQARTGEISYSPRCWQCNKLFAFWLTEPWRIRCPRCKAVNQAGADQTPPEDG